MKQLIVGGAAHNFTFEIGDGAIIKHSTKRAWRKYVDLGCENIFVVTHGANAKFFHSFLKRDAVYIACNHFGASFFAQLGHAVPRCTNALHTNGHSGKINLAAQVLQARLHGIKTTGGGERTWVATMADCFATHDMLRFFGHPIAKLRSHANIFRGDVRAVHGVDKATHGAALGFSRGLARLDQDHAFCAAHCKIGGGGFVCHTF